MHREAQIGEGTDKVRDRYRIVTSGLAFAEDVKNSYCGISFARSHQARVGILFHFSDRAFCLFEVCIPAYFSGQGALFMSVSVRPYLSVFATHCLAAERRKCRGWSNVRAFMSSVAEEIGDAALGFHLQMVPYAFKFMVVF